ncbi:MAG: SDR family NAD(P)-dependent oxidoreductase [Planctomycetota bacterium]
MKSHLKGKSFLVVGGTGSVGQALVDRLLEEEPRVVRIFSRDEAKQHAMRARLRDRTDVRFLLGDIRDAQRLRQAVEGIDVILHAAALKHVLACEYNPFEAVKTNVMGTQNVIDSALAEEVESVVFCSSDKAVNPTNAMGASKLMAERLITAANDYKGTRRTVFASVRFGNVAGSRGSVIPLVRRQVATGQPVTITHPDMTRFFMPHRQAVDTVLQASELARGGEVLVPKMPSLRIGDLMEALLAELGAPDAQLQEIGPQAGEKMHEELMTETEAVRALELADIFVVPPSIMLQSVSYDFPGARPARPSAYCSATATRLDVHAIRRWLREHVLSTPETAL